ncbi:hypothetical protein PRIPAC_84040 [Pristionchus pacificus]|uniref:Uncharacterized protein n=1 Tax=Pristionchus pacificus TaxID=54126 RepID=A0A2A6BTN2_PRIPA|nr:hypothetical protein PRIPAC_84040 [Pristionchus pacificus]|eukprot:PDM69260.1 hypothetical protein PRIPAC_47562 [Pristionchus pacificus]
MTSLRLLSIVAFWGVIYSAATDFFTITSNLLPPAQKSIIYEVANILGKHPTYLKSYSCNNDEKRERSRNTKSSSPEHLNKLANHPNLIRALARFSRVLMTMGILIFHIDDPLAPDAVISIEFYLGSQTRLIFAFILTEEFWKNCFRRHAVWSQRNVDMKNEYSHRHQHPREP